MKKVLIGIFIIVTILSIAFFVGQSYANNNSELELKETEYSERYQNWLNLSEEERKKVENKIIKGYVKSIREDNNLTPKAEKIINTYKNASFESMSKPQEL